jgi:multiple sugar transport system ATP-binding protein
VFSDAGRHHRRPAELAVRLAPYPAVGSGHPLAVAVRMEALHFFDDRGQRIDVGWR